jgi:hypothetical protein
LTHILGFGLDGFAVPENIVLRPVLPSEVRIVDESDPQRNVAAVQDRDTGTVTRLLPGEVDPGMLPQLTMGLDSGAIGRAGASFATKTL